MLPSDKQLRGEQIERYARHVLLPDIGGVGQVRLLRAEVAVEVGVDRAAEAVALAYLAAAGVGRLFLIGDTDGAVASLEVDHSILLGRADVGRVRSEALVARLNALNPEVLVSVARGGAPEQARRLAIPPESAMIAGGTDGIDVVLADALVAGGIAAARLITRIAGDKTASNDAAGAPAGKSVSRD